MADASLFFSEYVLEAVRALQHSVSDFHLMLSFLFLASRPKDHHWQESCHLSAEK